MIITSGTCFPAIELESLLKKAEGTSPKALLICEDGSYQAHTIGEIRICPYVALADQGRLVIRFLTEKERDELLTEEEGACILKLEAPAIVFSYERNEE